jgi:hypothetical protein
VEAGVETQARDQSHGALELLAPLPRSSDKTTIADQNDLPLRLPAPCVVHHEEGPIHHQAVTDLVHQQAHLHPALKEPLLRND